MPQQLIAPQTRASAFDTVPQADRAIRRLLAAGFSKDQLAVICPDKFREHFLPEAPQTEAPAADAGGAIAMGGAVGATLGGIALVATVITGGAIAGGFSSLIVSKGYEQEADDSYKQAIERGQIVVGVEVHGEVSDGRLAEAQRILDEAGANQLAHV